MRRLLIGCTLLLLGARLASPSAAEERGETTVTSIVLAGQATSMGQMLHAVLVEHEGSAASAPALRVSARPDMAIPYVALPAADGTGALAGLNALGISIAVEAWPRDQQSELLLAPGSPRAEPHQAVARVLELAGNLPEAVEMLSRMALERGGRFTVCDGRRLDARVVERFGSNVQVRKPFEGALAGCDPDAGLECFVGACDPDVPRCDPEGARGYPALRRLLEPLHGRTRADDLTAALANAEVARRSTAVVVVMEPQLGRMRLGTRTAADAPLTWSVQDLSQALTAEQRQQFAPLAPVDVSGPVTRKKKPLMLGAVELIDVSFRSPRPSGFDFNDVVRGVYYRPPEPRGAVIALPAWKESNLAGQGVLATRLAKAGFAVLVIPLPYQVDRAPPGVGSGAWTFSADLARTRAAFVQGAADVARAAHWLAHEEGFGPERVGVMGVSLGGHIAALAYGAYPEQLRAGAFLLAGGALETALLEPNRTTGRVRQRLLANGVTPEEARPLVELIDGAAWAKPERRAGVLLVGADADDVVPPRNVRALAEAYGGARTEWIPGDHYAILLHLGKTLDWVVEHFSAQLAPR